VSVEFIQGQVRPTNFPEPAELATCSIRTEDVQIELGPVVSSLADARLADARWVAYMLCLRQLKDGFCENKLAMLALNDGVTAHWVVAEAFGTGPDDYLLRYVDSAPLELGSFLEAGKNVAGCAASRCEGDPGKWLISTEELFNVLDEAIITVGPKNGDEDGSHVSSDHSK
jgi:hypothetical protein